MNTTNIKLSISPDWFWLLKEGKRNFAIYEVNKNWVPAFTTCKDDEKDIQTLYNSVIEYETITFYVPIHRNEITFTVDYFDIVSGKQLKLNNNYYFVVFLKK